MKGKAQRERYQDKAQAGVKEDPNKEEATWYDLWPNERNKPDIFPSMRKRTSRCFQNRQSGHATCDVRQ